MVKPCVFRRVPYLFEVNMSIVCPELKAQLCLWVSCFFVHVLTLTPPPPPPQPQPRCSSTRRTGHVFSPLQQQQQLTPTLPWLQRQDEAGPTLYRKGAGGLGWGAGGHYTPAIDPPLMSRRVQIRVICRGGSGSKGYMGVSFSLTVL